MPPPDALRRPYSPQSYRQCLSSPDASRVSSIPARGTLQGWLDYFNINNDNDPMFARTFGSWSEVEALNGQTEFSGSHVSVRLLNTGVNASTVPNN